MKTLSISAFLCVAIYLSIAKADDTEIFFSQNAGAANSQANLILILDNSGSMNNDGVSGNTTKLEDMKTAMFKILDAASNVNIGIVNFLNSSENHGSRLVYPVTSVNELGAREAMKRVVENIQGNTNTPIVGALYESMMVFRGGGIEESSSRYTSPMMSECQANKVVLLSDGQPYKNEAVAKTESLIGASCANTGTSDSEIGRKCGYELAEWMYKTNHEPSWTEPSNVSISTIGFNITSSFLQDVADLGGGDYYEASSSDDLVEVFTSILTNVVDMNSSFEAPAISIDQFNRMSHSNELYFAMFKPETSSGWSGNLKRYQTIFDGTNMIVGDVNGDNAIDSDTGLFLDSSTSFWSRGNDGGDVGSGGAASQLDSDNRNVLTHITGSSGSVDRGGEIISDRLISSNTSLAGYFPDMSEAERESVINWARGEDVNDEVAGSDERNHMGDILHSSPVIVNYASDSLIYVGTNDGFLHAIKKSTGEEIFSFIPEELIPNLSNIYNKTESLDRPYGLDGDIALMHDDDNGNLIVDGTEKAYLIFGMRRGGRNYYAMDIANPNVPKLLWKIEGGSGEFSRLGQSWSKPIPTKIFFKGNEKSVLIFGGGYDPINHDPSETDEMTTSRSSDSYGNTLYIVDAETGDLIWNAYDDVRGVATDMKYSIPSDLRVIDINGDSFADRIYVGDMGGQLWRFDINSYHQNDGSQLVDGGMVADLSTGSNHIRFYNEPDAAFVSYGGERFMSLSIGSGWRAHPLDMDVQDSFFMVRDNSPLSKPEGYGKLSGNVWNPIRVSDLSNVTRSISDDDEVDLEGWMLNLTTDGEKNLSRATTINNQVIFTTYAPSQLTDPCQPVLGQGYVYALDVVTGDPALALSGSSSASGTVEDRKKILKTQVIPPAASALLIDTGNGIQGSIMVGAENVLSDLPFSELTKRTYWQDRLRGNRTISQ